MDNQEKERMVQNLINKDRWQDVLSRFIDVLKINIVLVDFKGQMITHPEKKRYGWSFCKISCLGLGDMDHDLDILGKFERNGDYFEYACEAGLWSYAIPLSIEGEDNIGYLIVGPVILNKKQDNKFYARIAKSKKMGFNSFMDGINELRVISHLAMKSILDLLAEIAKDSVSLTLEKRRMALASSSLAVSEISQHGEEIEGDKSAQLNELLATLLDLALKMTSMECGSIMFMNKDREELSVRVSRGIDKEKARDVRMKLGEGLSGIAAKEKSSFVIHGSRGENRIKKLLTRPEIKHSVVMPLTSSKDEVLGVLNLHTKNEDSSIDDAIPNLKYLSRLISAAFQSAS